MGMISRGIQSIAQERAKNACIIEKITSETKEDVVDRAVQEACNAIFYESDVDMMSDDELEELIKELPADANEEKEEIRRIINVDDNDVDIDDIIGIYENIDIV